MTNLAHRIAHACHTSLGWATYSVDCEGPIQGCSGDCIQCWRAHLHGWRHLIHVRADQWRAPNLQEDYTRARQEVSIILYHDISCDIISLLTISYLYHVISQIQVVHQRESAQGRWKGLWEAGRHLRSPCLRQEDPAWGGILSDPLQSESIRPRMWVQGQPQDWHLRSHPCSHALLGQGRDPGRAEAAFLLQCTAHDPSPDDEEGGEMDERRKGDKSTPLPVQGGWQLGRWSRRKLPPSRHMVRNVSLHQRTSHAEVGEPHTLDITWYHMIYPDTDRYVMISWYKCKGRDSSSSHIPEHATPVSCPYIMCIKTWYKRGHDTGHDICSGHDTTYHNFIFVISCWYHVFQKARYIIMYHVVHLVCRIYLYIMCRRGTWYMKKWWWYNMIQNDIDMIYDDIWWYLV